MTRLKRRYLLGTVRVPDARTPEAQVKGLVRDVLALMQEVYGDEGLGAVRGQMALCWSSASGAFVLRTPATGYRRTRVCCALLSEASGAPCTASVERSTGSVEKAVVKMGDLLKRHARRRVRALRLAGEAGEDALLAALRADLASLRTVSGA